MSNRLQILLIEDNPGDADLIVELLPRDGPVVFEINNVDRLSKALECVSKGRFDLVLLDLGLPDSDGLETLRAIRTHFARLAIVVLTGNNDEQLGLASIQEGAQDYLIKGQIDQTLLVRSINYAIARKQDENALKELNDTLEERIVTRTVQLTSSNKKLVGEIADRKRVEEALREALKELYTREIELEIQNKELRRTQKELETSKTRYFNHYNLAPVGYLTFNKQGLLLEVNFTATNMLGVTREELVKQPFTNFIVPREQDNYNLFCKQLLETREPQCCELQLLSRDKTTFWGNLNGTVIQEKGDTSFYHIVVIDITKRKRAEEAVSESEERYRDLVQNVNSVILRWKHDGTVIFINDYALTFFGYREEEVVGRHVSILVPQKDSSGADLSRLFQDIMDHPERYPHNENENICQDGRRVWMTWANKVILDSNGQVIEVLAVGNDITARKQTEVYREMGREILQTLNDPGVLSGSFQHVVDIIKKRTGFDAVGIRLQDGDDFPYFAYNGFPQEFIQRENTLIGPTASGELCREENGNIRLECTCGLVLSGNIDPSSPLFTPGGSFWTNDSYPLLDIPPYDDPRFQPRNQCIFHDYASFALVPIRNTEQIVGLIQLNDHRKGCFTLNSVEILEGIASHIGAALLRKQSEEALLESEEKFRSLAESNTDYIMRYDKECRHTYMNPAALKISGMTEADVIGKTHCECGFPEDLTIFWEERIGQVFTTGRQSQTEFEWNSPHGTVYLDWRLTPEYDSEGRVRSVLGVSRDITKRRQADNIQNHLAAIVASSEDAIIGSDLNGSIQTWNVGAENIYGYTAEEVIGKNISLLVPLGQTSRNAYILNRILRNEKVENCEVDRVRKDGTIIPVSIFVSAIKDASGTAIGISRIAHDITKQKKAEQLETANVELERRVERRTQELRKTQEQFMHAEKLSAIGKLAASVAHEFNNPLQAILSILKGVKKRATMDEEDKELLDAAIGEGDRIKDLIRNLQEFNRPSSGRKTFMDMHSCLDSILILQKSEFMSKRITVVRNYAEQLPQIMAVSDQLKQVFLNLLANAADACPQSGGVITVSTWQEDDNRVAVAIKDTGMGIKPENMEQIFQPFYSTKGEVKGTGLGLSVSHGIIQDHEGNIRVESQPGEGAIFTILLPIKDGGERIPAFCG